VLDFKQDPVPDDRASVEQPQRTVLGMLQGDLLQRKRAQTGAAQASATSPSVLDRYKGRWDIVSTRSNDKKIGQAVITREKSIIKKDSKDGIEEPLTFEGGEKGKPLLVVESDGKTWALDEKSTKWSPQGGFVIELTWKATQEDKMVIWQKPEKAPPPAASREVLASVSTVTPSSQCDYRPLKRGREDEAGNVPLTTRPSGESAVATKRQRQSFEEASGVASGKKKAQSPKNKENVTKNVPRNTMQAFKVSKKGREAFTKGAVKPQKDKRTRRVPDSPDAVDVL